ncbi:hypothetical protein BDN72DRAFT_786105 [Pluteus cervinus]|uniref:Uncharacterized protein n=1 Tax=Pluteus cervinus TaxID=181527 RepID=A0ACD3BDK8_9AGAR|nr:hypothetical protein BDN72DRAFT_786105 [Pluteus cervinus]
MDSEVRQLVEMGATPAQARAALKQCKDVMQAAELFFEGKFDHVKEDEESTPPSAPSTSKSKRPATPDEDEDEEMGSDDAGDEDDDGEEEFMDYDSDFEPGAGDNRAANADPYAGIFFSKDRREEVIEVEEDPELVQLPGALQKVKLMSQGDWMKGCPEGGEQSFLFALYTQLAEGECPCPQQDCGYSVSRKKSDFFAIHPTFPVYIQNLREVVRQTCQECNHVFCFACGESVSADQTKRVGSNQTDDSLFHCSNLQGVILGVGLYMLEQIFAEQTSESSRAAEATPRTTKRRKTAQPDDDDDYAYAGVPQGKKAKGGTGYAGDQKEDLSGQAEALAIQRSKDEKIGILLSGIRVYLPNLHRAGGGQASDYLVHPTALAHLRRRFNYVCSTLLRNDSLADMSDRHVLYFELLHWLETISNHEALASMMAMPIMTVASVKSVISKKPQKGGTTHRERTIVYEGSPSPRELLEGIAIQAQAALKGLDRTRFVEPASEELTEEQKRMTADSKGKVREIIPTLSDENEKMLNFCNRILFTVAAIDRSLRETKGDAFVERLHASLPKVTTTRSADPVRIEAGSSDVATQKVYMDWATRVRFEYCDLTIPSTGDEDPDAVPHYKFYYNNEARMLVNSDIPKRSLAIAKELAILTTNLPVAWDSSIFLRVDETRVDVIKALITGPEGTPYYNGCYLFDIFLGSTYNQTPPSVKYMTTNGGKFRFNPNLYADGKVCLSLLGTWSGPGWVSGKSTLLQVLISIQSMILCDEPYLNEPGWASSGGTPQSQAYSANVRRMVVHTAMLGNLKNPPEPFEDVIRTHFRLKAKSIGTQLDDWLSKDDGKEMPNERTYGSSKEGSSGNAMAADIAELKKLMKDLQDEV